MTACSLHIEWFSGIRNLSGLNDLNSLNDLSGLNDLNSLISSKKLTELDLSIHPDTKMTYPGLLMWDGSSKIHCLIDFLHPFSWRLWRTGMLLSTNLKGHKPNVHYSEFTNHPKIKSSLNISICQSKLKHKCLPLDTLYWLMISPNIFEKKGILKIFQLVFLWGVKTNFGRK